MAGIRQMSMSILDVGAMPGEGWQKAPMSTCRGKNKKPLSQRRACFLCTGCNSRKLGLTKLPPVYGRSFWALGLRLVRRGKVLCFWVRQDFAQIAAADTWMHGRMDGGGGPEDALMDGRMD